MVNTASPKDKALSFMLTYFLEGLPKTMRFSSASKSFLSPTRDFLASVAIVSSLLSFTIHSAIVAQLHPSNLSSPNAPPIAINTMVITSTGGTSS